MNLNKAILGGRVTSDIELKQTTSGLSVCSFTVAVDRYQKEESEKQTDFIDCKAFGKRAETISSHFGKGSNIIVIGTIQKRSYETQDGQKRYAVEISVDEFQFVDRKEDAPQTVPAPIQPPVDIPPRPQKKKAEPYNPYIADAIQQSAFVPVASDEDLPF